MHTHTHSATSRFFAIGCTLLGLILLMLALTACGGPQESEPLHYDNVMDSKDDNVVSTAAISEYTIVRGDSSGNPVLKEALNLRSLVRSKSGSNLPLTTDFTEENEGQPEILVGYTNRKESIDVAKELNDGIRYIIRSVSNKIVIIADTQNNLAEAVEFFVREYVSSDAEKLAEIDYIGTNESLILANKNNSCRVVIPDNASEKFASCVQSMLDTLSIPEIRLVRYSAYNGGTAILLGTINEDEICSAYADTIKEGEYIARTAAENIYLLGHDELLTLTAFGDFLVDMQKVADKDLAGNRCLSIDYGYSFNNTWDFTVPKPFQATLDNSESISGISHIFYYSNVSEHSFALFKQMLTFLGYTMKEYDANGYVLNDTTLTLNYLSSDQTLSVLLDKSAQ